MRPLSLCLALLAGPVAACGPDTDCVIGDRTYRLYLPEGHNGEEIGAFFFAHGYRGSAAGAMRNGSLRSLADELGMAFVALKSAGEDWNLAHRPREPQQEEAREYDYAAAVIEDVATRVPLARDRLVVTGFSAGGMMTWTLACGMSESFAGFIPMSGTFWAPVPESCPTPPANIVHIHGTEDPVVPIKGRPIGETSQGDVTTVIYRYTAEGGFNDPSQTEAPGGLSCTETANPDGKILDLCLFTGGHSFSTERLRHGIDRVLGAS
ncbi:alpha/beta hydrolase family esterase [Aestuariibius sp. 2305UL40-4]|uniref:alpha/beta hydrolase family esterase n=1 Tax=Aestuariibius violaceus TaxID=3234132 RepID=UPI00345E73AD